MSKVELTRFWTVWNPSAGKPSHRHSTRAFADAEAARLASANPGHQFIVLKAVGGKCSVIQLPDDIAFVAQDSEDIPF